MNSISSFIRHVIVYSGHKSHPLLGPYAVNIAKQIEMFKLLNPHREKSGRPTWKVTSVAGEELVDALEESPPRETLLVIPAGPSSHLDQVFSPFQVSYIQDRFLRQNGGRIYGTCGTSYAMSWLREYNGLNPESNRREISIKRSVFPIFEGIAKGPLCPFAGQKYKVDFHSEAVKVTNGQKNCTVDLSGGGSFFLPEQQEETAQKVNVLVTYLDSELQRLGKSPEECKEWRNAAILAQVGKGSALLSMFHPDFGPTDIDVETCEQNLPESGTNWKALKENLTPLDERMQFVLESMIFPLEDA